MGLPDQELLSADWQKGYEAGARVRARIIYVDPISKRVCLSLLPHLVAGASSPPLPAINTLFEVRFSLLETSHFEESCTTLIFCPCQSEMLWHVVDVQHAYRIAKLLCLQNFLLSCELLACTHAYLLHISRCISKEQ